MQPYVNPNYYSQYNYNPYQSMAQNQYQSTPIQSGTRYVNNFNEIQVNEIPMDGKYVLFAKNDLTEVQAKAWLPNGTINTIEYVLKQPISDNSDSNPNNVTQIDLSSQFEPIMAEIKALNEKIDKLGKPATRKKVEDES